MPSKIRDYKHEYQLQQKRNEEPRRAERQRARRAIDKRDTGSVTKESPARVGKDVAHKKALDKGGSNKDGVYLTTPSTNRSFKRDGKSNLVSEISTKERKKK